MQRAWTGQQEVPPSTAPEAWARQACSLRAGGKRRRLLSPSCPAMACTRVASKCDRASPCRCMPRQLLSNSCEADGCRAWLRHRCMLVRLLRACSTASCLFTAACATVSRRRHRPWRPYIRWDAFVLISGMHFCRVSGPLEPVSEPLSAGRFVR